MPKNTVLIALLALSSTLATAAEEHTGLPHRAGFVDFRLGFGIPVASSSGLITAISPLPQLAGGIRLFNRLQLGVGFSFSRLSTERPLAPGMPPVTNAWNLLYFTPLVTFDVAHSRDNRAAFYLKAGLPIGADIATVSGAPDSTGLVVGYDVSLGTRYGFNSAFALGFEAGFAGLFVNPERDTNVGVTTFYSTLMGTYFFGMK